ncbi:MULTISPECIES: hypothetical protein [unclassified Archaeoglobus]|jgi:hypothetical protein|uniref:hypothetical protein n=1 Tax=unclassified Archaeoglobus TaxID=2643606 RepID=UPI0025C4E939|nr:MULTISPECIES: hypothetical protein [unclassified Archaeoglobus]
MIHAFLILLTLTTMQANPGDVLDVTVNESAVLSVNDSCVYFIESMTNTLDADAGSHEVKVGINCSPGIKEIKASGETLMLINVSEANKTYVSTYAAQMERKNLALQKKIEKLEENLNEMKTKYEESERQKALLKIDNELLQNQIKSLLDELNKSQKELKEKKGTLSILQSQLQSLSRQSQIYRLVTFFILSLFVGSYAALLYMSKKE